MIKNVTLTVDENVLAAARRYAAANHTSVNALIREALAQLAARAEQADEAWADLFARADQEGARSGRKRWSRDDLHDR